MEAERGEVRKGLCDAECEDERQDDREPGEPEDVRGDQGQDRALLADNAADQSVDADEERELAGIGAQAESRRLGRDGDHFPSMDGVLTAEASHSANDDGERDRHADELCGAE